MIDLSHPELLDPPQPARHGFQLATIWATKPSFPVLISRE
jgi:hypothetical protein